MRAAVVLIAVMALIGIGTVEAIASNAQLADLPGRGRPSLSAGGAALTIAGVALSIAVYAALGLVLAWTGTAEARAFVIGIGVGVAAGLAGGVIRAYLVSDYLTAVMAGYGLAGLVLVALAIFVGLSIVVSLAAGGVATWLGYRAGRRLTMRRPPR